jgi:hypothetical protein
MEKMEVITIETENGNEAGSVADSDPAVHFDAIRILPFNLMRSRILTLTFFRFGPSNVPK